MALHCRKTVLDFELFSLCFYECAIEISCFFGEACHSSVGETFHLEKKSEGFSFWTNIASSLNTIEEKSRDSNCHAFTSFS